MRAHGLADLAALVDAMARRPSLFVDVIDAITSTETRFFREWAPFQAFRAHILPHLLATRGETRRLQFWCAGCSTGQEAYSLAMALDEAAGALTGWTVDIVATDLSATAIGVAEDGLYSHFEVQRGLSTKRLLRYFRPDSGAWRVDARLRKRVAFRTFNLLSDYSQLGGFDVILCRNVLSAFTPEARRDVLTRLERALNDGGYMFAGADESVSEANAFFAPSAPDGVWRTRRRAPPNLRLA